MTQWVFAEKEWACMREGDLLWRGGGWFGEDNDKAEEGLKNNAAVVGTVQSNLAIVNLAVLKTWLY